MIRALLVSPSSAPGGGERALAALAHVLPSHGIEPVAVLLEPGPLASWLEAVGCPVEVTNAGRTRHLHRTAVAIGSIARLARRADVVVGNQSKGHVYAGAAAGAARRPALWWQHGIPERSRIEFAAARVPAAAVVAGSLDAVEAQRRLTPRHRIELIHPGIDVAHVSSRRGEGRSLRTPDGRRRVGIVGRLQEWKGQDVFLRAAALVARTHPDVDFVVVGGAILGWEGDYPERLHRLAADLQIEDRVHFTGHQDDVYPWFDSMDIVVHASRGEPFGLVLVEAMALGKPLIATASGGPVEIIQEGASGLLVPPGDAQSLASAMRRLLEDQGLRDTLAAGALARAWHFDQNRMAEDFAHLVHDVIGRRDPRSTRPSQHR